jgi:predicted ArsR family transcriptional regulator
MITRKEFVKSCAAAVCASGLCRSAKASPSAAAQEAARACNPKELTDTKNRADAARLRFARLVEVMEKSMPEPECKQILHSLGGKCADTYRPALIDRYKGNIHGFLEEGLRTWMAEAHYDESTGTIRVVDKSRTCSCPLVTVGETPATFCNCTLGWQEATYSSILGKPVKAELEESILRGDKRCVYKMHVI